MGHEAGTREGLEGGEAMKWRVAMLPDSVSVHCITNHLTTSAFHSLQNMFITGRELWHAIFSLNRFCISDLLWLGNLGLFYLFIHLLCT